jgi:hypothetical protein
MMQGAEPLADQIPSGRQFVILSNLEPGEPGALAPIGPRAEIVQQLIPCNTASERTDAGDVLYGPGIRIEMTPGQDPITQMLITITEEEIGWKVLTRLVSEFHWKLLDPSTGREPGSAGRGCRSRARLRRMVPEGPLERGGPHRPALPADRDALSRPGTADRLQRS